MPSSVGATIRTRKPSGRGSLRPIASVAAINAAVSPCNLELNGAHTEDESSIVMTTWHTNDSLEDAAEFFRDAVTPQGRYASCDLWLAAAVGHPEWAARLRTELT